MPPTESRSGKSPLPSSTGQRELHRFDNSVWYRARIARVQDHVEPGWKRVRNRMRLDFAVDTSRGPRHAHVYVDMEEDWRPTRETEELLRELLHPVPVSARYSVLKQNLEKRRYKVKFGPPSATGQRQALAAVERLSDEVLLPRTRDWSSKSITIDLAKNTVEIYEGKKIRQFPLPETPTIVRRLLLGFFALQGSDQRFDERVYAKKSRSKLGARENLRKAMQKLRQWLNGIDARRHWGNALKGKPRLGYELLIRVRLRERTAPRRELAHGDMGTYAGDP